MGPSDLDKKSFESKEQLGPLFERFFILGGPRGTRQKKLQNSDPIQLEGGFGGIRFPHVKGFSVFSYKVFQIIDE